MKLKHPVLMIFVFVAVLALCRGAAHAQDDVQPTNDLPELNQSCERRFGEVMIAEDHQ